MSDHKKRILSESLVVFIFMSFSYVVAYLIRLLYARNLTPEEFGLFYAVLGFINFFIIFRDLGLSETLVKFIPEFIIKKEFGKIKGGMLFVALVQLTMGLLIISVMYLLSDYLAINLFRNPLASTMIKMLGVFFLADGLVEVCILALRGFQKTRYYAMGDFIQTVFILSLSVVLFQFLQGAIVPTIVYMIAPLITFSVLMYFLMRSFDFMKHRMVLNKELRRTFWDYSLKLLIGTGAGIILGYLDTILLTYYSGVEQVGIFNVAFPTAKLLFIFARPIQTILFPFASEHWAKGEPHKIAEVMEMIYSYFFVIVIPVVLTFFTYPEIIVRVIFGEKFLAYTTTIFGAQVSQVGVTLQIIAFSVIFYSFAMLNFQILQGMGKPLEVTKAVYIAAFFHLIFAFAFIPSLGSIGAAIATTVSNITHLIVSFVLLRKHMRLVLPYKVWAKTILAGVVFLVALSVLKDLIDMPVIIEMLATVAISGLLYLIAVFILKLIKKDDIVNAMKLVRR